MYLPLWLVRRSDFCLHEREDGSASSYLNADSRQMILELGLLLGAKLGLRVPAGKCPKADIGREGALRLTR